MDFNKNRYKGYFGYAEFKNEDENNFRAAIFFQNGRQHRKMSTLTDFNEILYQGYFGYAEFKNDIEKYF